MKKGERATHKVVLKNHKLIAYNDVWWYYDDRK